ncbi:hypothetical protein CYMTET_50285 [Cymbomonas tetramitiformis]|uniref:Uncharacterized protein n=1 Tax=Cymbomonas tetramitiformis TaxID=36881 RepID=A0AAE0BQD3_9CHLO|nr:hypothetical protein CYMTET_50285 [Cymbomonas tetramitiformis]
MPKFLVSSSSKDRPKLRLFCFPHAGGGPQVFQTWGHLLGEDVEVLSVQLPGRGSRSDEAPLTDISKVVPEVLDELYPLISSPYAFFGHSLGSLVAYEVAAALQQQGFPAPLRIFVSSHASAFEEVEPVQRVYALPDEQFLNSLMKYGLMPDQLLHDNEMKQLVLPSLRADMAMNDTYACAHRTVLECCVTAYGGKLDGAVSERDLAGWARVTSDQFDLQLFDGDHFYFQADASPLLERLQATLQSDLEKLPLSILSGASVETPATCVHELIYARATSQPDTIAVEDEHCSLTYLQLQQRASRLAAFLFVQRGCAIGCYVGALLEHDASFVVAALAVHKAGGAFFPFERHFSEDMLQVLLDKAPATVAILTTASLLQRVPSSHASKVVSLDEEWWNTLPSHEAEITSWPAPGPDDLAFLTFTSGTTGTPKAVLCPQRALMMSLLARQRRFPYGEGEREAFNVMIVWEMLRPLAYGHTAVIIPDRHVLDGRQLIRFLGGKGVTRLLTTPSLLTSLLGTPGLSADLEALAQPSPQAAPPALRVWYLCGEVVHCQLAAQFKSRLPGVALVNSYSSWEGSDVTLADLTTEASSRLSPKVAPAGRVLDGAVVYILDHGLAPVPHGVVGRIFVRGGGVAQGYLGDAENTAQAFVTDPVRADGGVVYDTGDLGRLLPDGQLEVLGRVGTAVKIRGFKVGLQFVQRAAEQVVGAGKAVVQPVKHPDTGEVDNLCLYVVRETTGEDSEALAERAWRAARESLRHRLTQHLPGVLPHYAVPAFCVVLRAWPVGLRGSSKLDLRALPAPGEADRLRVAGTSESAPLGPSAGGAYVHALASAAASLLQVSEVDAHANLFELGLHSLLAAQLIANLRSEYGIQLTVLDLFQHPTVAALAALLAPEQPNPAPGLELWASSERAVRGEPVAVVGMAGKFPGAADVGSFWQLLTEGRDALRTFTHPELRDKGVPEAVLQEVNFVPVGQVVDGADLWDHRFWGIGRGEAKVMDPQHRLFMEVSWEALESAGLAPRTGTPEDTGVFASCGIDGYLVHHLDGAPLKDPLNPLAILQAEVGNEKDYISAIATGQCRAAVCGGASLTFPNMGYVYAEGLVSSSDGRVRPFDQMADGTLFGDSIGAVICWQLGEEQDQRRRGRHHDMDILAILEGSGVTNDGARKASFSAPNSAAQRNAILAAHRMAGASAAQVSYVECHATGTLVGDAIEMRGLAEAFKHSARGEAVDCAVGSVKGNIGHANCAAGITGLIKALSCMQHRSLVPTAHFSELNTKIDLAGTGLYVHEGVSSSRWEPRGVADSREMRDVVRAGVSSFGIGGTNAHVLLASSVPERAPSRQAPGSSDEPLGGGLGVRRHSWELLTVCGHTEWSLRENAARLVRHLRASNAPSIADLAYTAHLGREPFPLRVQVVAQDAAQAASKLEQLLEAEVPSASAAGPKRLVMVFPGQGSQYLGMGAELYAEEPAFCAHVDQCCALLHPLLGADLREAMYPEDVAQPEAQQRFMQASVLQPALFVTEYALARTLMSWGLVPAAVAGHSIGEYVAAVVAGVMTLEDALQVVVTRALATESETQPGTMLSVGVPCARAAELLAAHPDLRLDVAAANTPEDCVLAGTVADVEALVPVLEEQGIRCSRLHVARGFHSWMMAPAAERVVEYARGGMQARLRSPRIPMTSNVTGGWLSDEACAPEYWGEHMAGTVRWAENVACLLRWDPAAVLEVGPGAVLSTLISRCQKASQPGAKPAGAKPAGPRLVQSMRRPNAKAAESRVLTEGLGKLWEGGVSIDWEAYHQSDAARSKVSSPSYAFERNSYWINPNASIYAPAEESGVVEAELQHEGRSDGSSSMSRVSSSSQLSFGTDRLMHFDAEASLAGAMKVYCLPFAGGSATVFGEWAAGTPAWVNVVGVELSGRGAQADSDLMTSEEDDLRELEELVSCVAEDAGDQPVVLLGLSMGAMLWASIVPKLANAGVNVRKLAVVGRAPPRVKTHPLLSGRESAPLRAEDVEEYVLVSEETRRSPAWAAFFLPMLLSDLATDGRAEARVVRRLSGQQGSVNSSPLETASPSGPQAAPGGLQSPGEAPPSGTFDVDVYCAWEDPSFDWRTAGEWQCVTAGRLAVDFLPGGHDFMNRHAGDIMRKLVHSLWEHRPNQAGIPLNLSEGNSLALTEAAHDAAPSPLYSVQWQPIGGSEADGSAARRSEADASDVAEEGIAAVRLGADIVELTPAMVTAMSGEHGLVLCLEHAVLSDHGKANGAVPEADAAQCWALVHLMQALAAEGAEGRVVLVCPASPRCAPAAGATKALPYENSDFSIQRVFVSMEDHPEDLAWDDDSPLVKAARRAAAAAALHPAETDLWLRRWQGRRQQALLAPRLLPMEVAKAGAASRVVDRGASYLITGGTGGIGRALVRWLVEDQGVAPEQLCLLTRSPQGRPQYAGMQLCQVDCSDLAAMLRHPMLQEIGNVAGVFHLAGSLDDGLLTNMTPERMGVPMKPKAASLALLELIAAREWCLDWMVVWSSTSSLLGYPGQTNYCAANSLLDQLVQWPRHTCGTPLVGINWGPWGEAGMAAKGTKAYDMAVKTGELPMDTALAMAALATILHEVKTSGATKQFAVADVEWHRSPFWKTHPLISSPAMVRQNDLASSRSSSSSSLFSQGHSPRGPLTIATSNAADASESRRNKLSAGSAARAKGPSVALAGERDAVELAAREFLREHVDQWSLHETLVDLGLDSLDLVQLRSSFQERFKVKVPLSTFTTPRKSLGEVLAQLVDNLMKDGIS